MAALSTNVPTGLVELGKPSWTLAKRAEDVLALFDHPTEAFNGQLEHLRGSALSFRNLTKYVARSLLEADGSCFILRSQMR